MLLINKLKRIFLSAILPCWLFSCSTPSNNNTFELKGKLSNANGGNIYLEALSPEGINKIDSAIINAQGEFLFNKTQLSIGFYNLKLNDRNFITLVFDSLQKINLHANANDLANSTQIEGSYDSKLFIELNETSVKTYKQRDSLTKFYQAYINAVKIDAKKIDSMSAVIEQPFNKLIEQHNNYLLQLVEKNNTSLVAIIAIQQLNPKEFLPVYIKLDKSINAKYPDVPFVKLFHKRLTQLQESGHR